MSVCPFHKTAPREGLPPLIPRIAALPVDERGYPIPFFVGYVEGKADFRVADQQKWARCHRERLCWTCGQQLGRHVTFVIGPMCTINRTTAEPPSHQDCATWSVQGCPFLSRPNMVRREGGIVEENKGLVAGNMIERNPGVTCLWTVTGNTLKPRGYKLFPDGQGRALIEIGIPSAVSWWREGRPATRAEVNESIASGLPLLEKACDEETLVEQKREARQELAEKLLIAMQYLPPEASERSLIIH